MALVPTVLETAIKAASQAAKAAPDVNQAENIFAQQLALAIHNYIISATVVGTGVCSAGGGPVTATIS